MTGAGTRPVITPWEIVTVRGEVSAESSRVSVVEPGAPRSCTAPLRLPAALLVKVPPPTVCAAVVTPLAVFLVRWRV